VLLGMGVEQGAGCEGGGEGSRFKGWCIILDVYLRLVYRQRPGVRIFW